MFILYAGALHGPRKFVIKTQNDWRDVGQPQVAMRRNCHVFLLLSFVCRLERASKTDAPFHVFFPSWS